MEDGRSRIAVLEQSSLGLAVVLLVALLAFLAMLPGTTPTQEPSAISVVTVGVATTGARTTAFAADATGARPEPTGQRRPGPAVRQQVDAGWLASTATRTGIPERALAAYATADLRVTADLPGCRLHWPTLAGIGALESGHGTAGGGLGRGGTPARPIIGIALDGRPGIASVTDSDAGLLDGDRTHDRAVGPMQFVPSTWASWRVDGDDDGVANPQDLDDAALAAAHYLCSRGSDLSSASGWTRAVFGYNASMDYVLSVNQAAVRYAGASRG